MPIPKGDLGEMFVGEILVLLNKDLFWNLRDLYRSFPVKMFI